MRSQIPEVWKVKQEFMRVHMFPEGVSMAVGMEKLWVSQKLQFI